MSLEQLQEHSPRGPSSADRWMNCAGSVAATAGLPDTTSEYAAEGTFAHYISELARNDDCVAKVFLGRISDDGKFVCNQEMVDGVQYFLDYLDDAEFDETLVEARVNYNAWVDDGFGTADDVGLKDGTCRVVDLKYGKGVQIWAEENRQLKLYALGVYQEHGDLYDITGFDLVICQPRLDHIDEWYISIEDLLKWADDVVEPAADLTTYPDAPFKAGEWCRWCKIKASCKYRAAAVSEALVDELEELANPAELTDKEIGLAFAMVDSIRSWCNDLSELVMTKVSAGKEIIGSDGQPFKIVEGRSNRCWRDDDEAEKSMRGFKMKVVEMYIKKLISPTQCEKILGKGHPVLKKHCIKPQGKPVLVAGSDKRQSFKVDVSELD